MDFIEPVNHQLATSKGEVSALVYGSSNKDRLIIISSATGVKQEFYTSFAQYLVGQNFAVITFDYGGIGQSLKGQLSKSIVNVVDWGRLHLEAVLQFAVKEFPQAKKYLLGHSIGGQIIGLAPTATKMDALIMIAGQSGYWCFWTGKGRRKMWGNWFVLFPLLLKLFPYLPSKKISGMENLPHRVAEQWSRWGRHKDYLFSEVNIDTTVYQQLEQPLTAYCIADDPLAPQGAVEWMLDQYSEANKKLIHVLPEENGLKKIGHFGFFKAEIGKKLWPQFINHLTNSNQNASTDPLS